jgi:hypothetical protein
MKWNEMKWNESWRDPSVKLHFLELLSLSFTENLLARPNKFTKIFTAGEIKMKSSINWSQKENRYYNIKWIGWLR